MQQILDKTWKIWQSFDPAVGFKWQFQYSRNLDVSNIKNWITLSSLVETKVTDSQTVYCVYDYGKLVRFFSISPDFIVSYSWNTDRPTTSYVIWQTTSRVYKAISFQNLVYGFWQWYAVTVVPNVWWAIIDITAWITWTDPDTSITHTFGSATALMNYNNSLLLVADWNKLRRYVPVASPWLPIWWKVIRNFEDGTIIKWLTMEWNYLKIRVQDKYLQTKVHYAQWTFDVEYAGLVQTIKLENQIILSVESDMNYDYVLCRNSFDWVQYYLYRMQWVNKTLIKRTLITQWWYRNDFMYPAWENMQIKKWILYVPMLDWIRTFRNESVSSGLSTWNVSAPVLSRSPFYLNRYPYQCIIFWNYLYTSYQVWLYPNQTYAEDRVEIEFRPAQYQPTWFLIWLINDWLLMAMDKTNFQLNLWYLLPKPTLDSQWYPTIDPWKINIYLRYDRESLWLWGWWNLVKTLDNRSTLRERVLLTTDNNFRRDRNVLEYKIEFVRSTTTPSIAPTFFEYNHLYDFTNRIDVIWNYKSYPPPTPTP